MYKCIKKLAPGYLSNMFSPKFTRAALTFVIQIYNHISTKELFVSASWPLLVQ